MNKYARDVLEMISKKHYWEKAFLQSIEEVFKSISVILEQDFVYQEHRILEQLVEPDRIISFRVPWRDDRGNIQVNCGYRVEFNNVLGPYKGGLRFHASVDQSTLKSLAFEQVFKNALTGLLLGGGKGGSDFSPRGRSDNEIMNFCQSFMLELAQYIKCPVVAIHGAYDPHPAQGVQKPLSAILKDFRFILIEKCGHDPWHEKHARESYCTILEDELAV